ncbi:MAG TPA: IS4 family transposase [Candidatus Tectomicrobia bacterium]
MSDNLRRYRAIREALTQGYPGELHGRGMRHLTTLAALISGIVGGKSTQLPHIATKVPDGTKPESRVKRFTRWLDNDRILEEVYFLPYVALLLTHLALETLVVVMDGSVVGRGCMALMLHVVYKGRALPLAWRVRQSPKGHCPEALHIEVVELISQLIPEGSKVVFLGDGEFDGTDLQRTLHEIGWSYVCRTAMSTTATWNGQPFRLDTLGACLKPGRLIALQDVHFTREAYGPIMVLCCWAKGHIEPLYLVSNMDAAEEACRYYQKRFRIETFFSDQKSRGFHIQKSHISDVQRLSRLLIAACLAYIWIVYLGALCETEGLRELIHRRKRCDLSLFQLGLRVLEHFLNEELPIPVQFHVTI